MASRAKNAELNKENARMLSELKQLKDDSK
jgi:hypothetical protein